MEEIPPHVRASLELLTVAQVAELLQVTTEWLYDQCALNAIPHLRLGRTIRFRAADIAEYLDGRRRADD